MIDYSEITNRAISKIKNIRNKAIEQGWNTEILEARKTCYFDFGGVEQEQYNCIINESKKWSIRMVLAIILELLNERKIDYKPLMADDEVVGIIAPQESYSVAYIFHEFLEKNTWSPDFIDDCKQKYDVDKCIGVVYMRESACSVIFNHDDNTQDPMRGTNQLPLKYFFASYFGMDEYERFDNAMVEYEKQVKAITGMRVIKTLEPGALHNYKRIVNSSLVEFANKYLESLTDIVPEQELSLLKENILYKRYYTALVGNRDFAQSFITAEWMYEILKDGGEIDYVPVAMGYFKCIEQLLYSIILMHKDEGRKLKRKFIKNDTKYTYTNKNGEVKFEQYVPINNENIIDGRLDTTLGSMVKSFFCYEKNIDIYINDLPKALEYITGRLSVVAPLRNGYFHKDNISRDDWTIIEKARKCAFEICLLLLGSCKFTDQNVKQLDIKQVEETEFYKLCQYVNDHSDMQLYCFANGNNEDSITAQFIKGFAEPSYDRYGEAVYQRIEFQYVGKAERIFIKEDNMPDCIYSASLNASSIEKLFNPSMRIIFKNGKFCGCMDDSKIEY